MNPYIAPPGVLGALSYEVGVDRTLRPGIHLRIFAGNNASFPITPFVVLRVKGRVVRGEGVVPVRRAANQERDFISSLKWQDGETPVRLTFNPVGGTLKRLSMLDSHSRELASRHRGPWTYSLPAWHSIRMEGSASWAPADALFAPGRDLWHGALGRGIAAMALTVREEPPANYAWYIGSDLAKAKRWRVGRAAPVAWGPREQSVFERLAPTPGREQDEECDRVAKVLSLAPHLPAAVRKMVSSADAAPWTAEYSTPLGNQQQAIYNPLAFLQLGMADYGCARHFGYATYWSPEELQLEPDELLAIAAIVVLDPNNAPEAEVGALKQQLMAQTPAVAVVLENQILDALSAFELATDPGADLARIKALAKTRGFLVASLVTYTAPVAPYDPPALPSPQVLRRQWSLPSENEPSDSYSAVFAFENVPVSFLALLERQGADGAWNLRSGSDVDDTPDVEERRLHQLKPMLLGRESEAATRLAELSIKYKPNKRAALLSDQQIPATGPALFRASAADCFGRFGPSVQFDSSSPDRPRPPAPVLAYSLKLAAPASAVAESPGKLVLKLRFDASTNNKPDSDELAVPALSALPRGANSITELRLQLQGAEELFEDGSANLLPSIARTADRNSPVVEIDLPPLKPCSVALFVLGGKFVDINGVDSLQATVSVRVTDPRPPTAPKTGLGLLWTTRPSPSPDVTVDLVWTAPTGSKHLVYIGDERAVMQNIPSGSRGARGAYLCAQAEHHDRSMFQRVTRDPLTAAADGKVRYTLALPRTLETVQVLRVVTLGPDGAEPPFGLCTVVPIAVPSSRRPPPPMLVGDVDPVGKPKLTVIADGFDLVELKRDESGLFPEGGAGTETPMFRVRCSSGPVAHPMYAPIQQFGAASSEDGVLPLTYKFERLQAQKREWFEGAIEGDPLQPYVRYVFWAEARLPAERCVPADTQQLLSGVRPVHAEAEKAAVRLWSASSAPVTLMHAPLPPALVVGDVAYVVVDNGPPYVRLQVTLNSPPTTSPKAVGQFRLAVWYRWGDGQVNAVMDSNGNSMEAEWPVVEDVADLYLSQQPAAEDPLRLHVALVDPCGRLGPVTILQ